MSAPITSQASSQMLQEQHRSRIYMGTFLSQGVWLCLLFCKICVCVLGKIRHMQQDSQI